MEQEQIAGKNDPKTLPVLAVIILFFAGFVLITGTLTSIATLVFQQTADTNMEVHGLLKYVILESCMLLGVIIPIIILLYVERRSFSDLGLTLQGHVKDIFYGTLAAILFYSVGFGLSLSLGVVQIVGYQLDWNSLISSWFFYLLVAFTEEIMMRGYVLGRLLCTRMNKFLAMFISSALFALLHVFNPDVSFLPMLNLVLAGMLLGVTYLYTRNLWFPIALHLFWNWIQGSVLGYQVSGIDFSGSLLTLRLPEENWINGGGFGFEGSLICTVLTVIAIGGVVWYFEVSSQPSQKERTD